MKNHEGEGDEATGSEKEAKNSAKAEKRKKKKKPKLPKLPGQPKRPMSGFFMWLNTEGREQIKKENPCLSVTEVSKKAGEIWARKLDIREKYEKKSKEVREKYNEEYKEWWSAVSWREYMERWSAVSGYSPPPVETASTTHRCEVSEGGEIEIAGSG